MNKFIGKLIVFEKDDDVLNADAVFELTEFTKTGFAEVAFDYGKQRIYVQIPLAPLMTCIADNHGSTA
jgi:hypothetical protein